MYPFISTKTVQCMLDCLHMMLLSSGGHFNPAVSVCVYFIGGMELSAPGAVCAVTNVRWSDCCQPRQSMCLSFSINICDLTWLDFNTDDNALTFFPSLSMLQDLYLFFLIKAVTTNEAFANATGAAFDAVQSSHGTGSATVAEMIMTLFLTMVVSMGAVNGRTRSHLAPFCIGLTVTAIFWLGRKLIFHAFF